jgi:hypothetical protein
MVEGLVQWIEARSEGGEKAALPAACLGAQSQRCFRANAVDIDHRDPRFPPRATTERQLEVLERKYQGHDKQIATMLATLRQLMNPSARERRGTGFTADL